MKAVSNKYKSGNRRLVAVFQQRTAEAIDDCTFDAGIVTEKADEMICNALSEFAKECEGADVSGWREAANCRESRL